MKNDYIRYSLHTFGLLMVLNVIMFVIAAPTLAMPNYAVIGQIINAILMLGYLVMAALLAAGRADQDIQYTAVYEKFAAQGKLEPTDHKTKCFHPLKGLVAGLLASVPLLLLTLSMTVVGTPEPLPTVPPEYLEQMEAGTPEPPLFETPVPSGNITPVPTQTPEPVETLPPLDMELYRPTGAHWLQAVTRVALSPYLLVIERVQAGAPAALDFLYVPLTLLFPLVMGIGYAFLGPLTRRDTERGIRRAKKRAVSKKNRFGGAEDDTIN